MRVTISFIGFVFIKIDALIGFYSNLNLQDLILSQFALRVMLFSVMLEMCELLDLG